MSSCTASSLKYQTALGLLIPILMTMLVGCQASPPPAGPGTTVEPLDEVSAWQPPPAADIWTVDARASEFRVLVYRAGALAALGHDHVIAGPVEGEIFRGASAAASAFRLSVRLDTLQVDRPEARADEGQRFAPSISEAARESTRANLLGPAVLDAAQFPEILIESLALDGPRWNPTVSARVLLRGEWRRLSFPAAVVEDQGRLVIVATLRLSQAALGMEPFSVLGGSLQVADELDVRLRIVATPASD
jgi:polyisoprenoid-binding protein YceI